MENQTPSNLLAPVTLETSPSFRTSTSSKLDCLYEITHLPISEDNQISDTTIPFINPYTAFSKPSQSPIRRIRSLIRQPASPVLEYIQASKFNQHHIMTTQMEQFVTLQLPTDFSRQWMQKGYTHLHFGAIRLALIYHGRKGLPVTARMALLDTRFMDYQHACIGTIETTLNVGTVFVTLYPSFCMSLQDPKMLTALQVQLQLNGPRQTPDFIEATLHYQMSYRVQNHALDLKVPEASDDALYIAQIEQTTGVSLGS